MPISLDEVIALGSRQVRHMRDMYSSALGQIKDKEITLQYYLGGRDCWKDAGRCALRRLEGCYTPAPWREVADCRAGQAASARPMGGAQPG